MKPIKPTIMLTLVATLMAVPLPVSARDDEGSASTAQMTSVEQTKYPGPIAEPAIAPSAGQAPNSLQSPSQLDSAIMANMATHHLPGLSACVVLGDDVVWTGSYGFKDAALSDPVGDTTLFRLASISKTFVATAIMRLWEDGLIDIDADVNDYLPFTVENPDFPDTAITARMLMAHVSSIDRRNETWYPHDLVCGQNHPIPLDQYMEDYLDPLGVNYSPDNYLDSIPGTFGLYTNYGYGVLGVLVEQTSGMSLEDYCQAAIFADSALGMTETSWLFENLDSLNMASPMAWQGTEYLEWCHSSGPIGPAGGLRSSAIQLARHVSAFLGFGMVEGNRVLDSTTVAEMRTVQYPGTRPFSPTTQHGLGWYTGGTGDDQWWGHGGTFRGIRTDLYCRPFDNTGLVLACNTDLNTGYQIILNLIWNFSRDADLDGIIAGLDNCPDVHNPGQGDINNNGVGDACDETCPVILTGDVDLSGAHTSADIIWLVNYVFKGGSPPQPCEAAADVDCSEAVTSADIIFMVNFVFKGGPSPCDVCAWIPGTWTCP